MVKWFVLGLVLCGGLTACARTDGIALEGQEGAPAQLQVENSSMARRLTLTQAQQQRQDGRLQVAIRLKSEIAYDQELQYRIDWFDASGMPVEPDSTSWQPLKLHGGEQKVMQFSALLPQAAAFHFSVRDVVKD